MNILNILRRSQEKKARLARAKMVMTKTKTGTDYTSAHLAPTILSSPKCVYRGVSYTK